MRALTILLAALTCVSCDDNNNHKSDPAGIRFDPFLAASSAIVAQISPSPLSIVPIPTFSCPLVPAFTTAFDLVVVATGERVLFMDRVTLRLNDGSNLGGPMVTIPRVELNSIFGSTRIAGRRAFPFRPQFGCGVRRPKSIFSDVDLIDPAGAARRVTATAAF